MEQLKEIEKLNNKKAKLIDRLTSDIEKLVRSNQRKLADIVDELLDNLVTNDDGTIRFTQSNISVNSKISLEIKKFSDEQKSPFIKRIISFVNQIIAVDSAIYKVINKEFTKKLEKQAKNLVFRSLGFNNNTKKLIKNSFLDSLTSNVKLITDISNRLNQQISSGGGLRSFKKEFKQDFTGRGKNQLGLLEREFNTFSRNILQQTSSAVGKVYADELELNHFIYVGDTIRDSRNFCRQRIGNNIYTREFGQNWSNLEYKGKIQGGDFFLNRGGHNCRHSISWITDELVELLLEQGYKLNKYNSI